MVREIQVTVVQEKSVLSSASRGLAKISDGYDWRWRYAFNDTPQLL